MKTSVYAIKLFLLLALAANAHAEQYPQRIVSINLCTDQLLLLLVEPERIVSLSNLSREPHSSYLAAEAERHTVNQGRAEQLLPLKPDLILAGTHAAQPTVRLMRNLGYRVELFPMAAGIEDIRRNIRRLAALVGESARGEELISDMDRRIDPIAERHQQPTERALMFQPRGYTSGSGTLQDEALRLAGWRNVAAEAGIEGFGVIGVEQLLHSRPQQLFTSSYAPGTESRAQQLLHHPALARATGDRAPVEIDYRLWICGGPMIAEAIEQLAAAHSR
jgi:iron complex transport system substrate-binding protein